nr:hypothetical protein [Leptolyngbya sp. 7M]
MTVRSKWVYRNEVKLYAYMNKLGVIGLVFVLTAMLAVTALGVKDYRLRANINPGCATSSSLKYADIYADGNIAVMGSYNCRGVFIFDISNPDAPVLRSWYNPGANLQFLEAIVVGNRGYFGTGNTGGVHIVDLTNPSNPQMLGIVNSTNGGGHNTIHEIMIHEQNGATYLIENSNSLSVKTIKIINVTNPAQPVLVHTFATHTQTNRTGACDNNNSRLAEGSGEESDLSIGKNIGVFDPALLLKTCSNPLLHVRTSHTCKSQCAADYVCPGDRSIITSLVYSFKNV